MKQRKTCSIMWVFQLIALPVLMRYNLFVVNVNYGCFGWFEVINEYFGEESCPIVDSSIVIPYR